MARSTNDNSHSTCSFAQGAHDPTDLLPPCVDLVVHYTSECSRHDTGVDIAIEALLLIYLITYKINHVVPKSPP